MPVAVVLDFKGATLEQYDQVIERLGLDPGGRGPPGSLFHWVTKTDEGIRVTDVWQDRETFQRYIDEQVDPVSRAVGVPSSPEIAFHEVHSHQTAG
jgi:hypothetical protein